MEIANEWIRGVFILYPVIAVLVPSLIFKSNFVRMFIALGLGGFLLLALFYTTPDIAHPLGLFVYFGTVVITGLIAFSLRNFQSWVKRLNEA